MAIVLGTCASPPKIEKAEIRCALVRWVSKVVVVTTIIFLLRTLVNPYPSHASTCYKRHLKYENTWRRREPKITKIRGGCFEVAPPLLPPSSTEMGETTTAHSDCDDPMVAEICCEAPDKEEGWSSCGESSMSDMMKHLEESTAEKLGGGTPRSQSSPSILDNLIMAHREKRLEGLLKNASTVKKERVRIYAGSSDFSDTGSSTRDLVEECKEHMLSPDYQKMLQKTNNCSSQGAVSSLSDFTDEFSGRLIISMRSEEDRSDSLFRSIARNVYGDDIYANNVRIRICDWMSTYLLPDSAMYRQQTAGLSESIYRDWIWRIYKPFLHNNWTLPVEIAAAFSGSSSSPPSSIKAEKSSSLEPLRNYIRDLRKLPSIGRHSVLPSTSTSSSSAAATTTTTARPSSSSSSSSSSYLDGGYLEAVVSQYCFQTNMHIWSGSNCLLEATKRPLVVRVKAKKDEYGLHRRLDGTWNPVLPRIARFCWRNDDKLDRSMRMKPTKRRELGSKPRKSCADNLVVGSSDLESTDDMFHTPPGQTVVQLAEGEASIPCMNCGFNMTSVEIASSTQAGEGPYTNWTRDVQERGYSILRCEMCGTPHQEYQGQTAHNFFRK